MQLPGALQKALHQTKPNTVTVSISVVCDD